MSDNLRFSRREFLKLSSLFTLSGALPLLSAFEARAAAEPNAPVRIGYLPITDATPLLVAHQQKFYQEQGLEVEPPRLFRSWAQLVEAFIAGQVNVVHLLSPMTVWARYSSKVPAKVVAWNHVGGSALTVHPDVKAYKDLGGKTLAVPFWYSMHNVVLQKLLQANNLNIVTKAKDAPIAANEVNLIVLPPSDMTPALANRSIEGFIVAEPFNANAELLKVGKVLRFTGDVWKNHACCVVFMHEKDLNERPEWTQKVVNSLVQAQAWTRNNREQTARLLSKEGENKYTPHSYDALARVLLPNSKLTDEYISSGAIKNPQWHEARIDFQPYPFPSYTESLVDALKTTKIEGDQKFLADLKADKVVSDLVDDRFVKIAVEKLGGLSKFGFPDSFTREEIFAV